MTREEQRAGADGPAVTTGALSAAPAVRPDGDEGGNTALPEPPVAPGEAAKALRTSAGGELAEPDLAEVTERDLPSLAAAEFEVALPDRHQRPPGDG
ncbi:hypothetical protein FHX82_005146 [Amycolatopsis bartoniae]|uniref:Uncharacterized protein n=1 Tax=Amycolatopsis bartoniae TaxID=941986 RepID=A0A8H9MB35_9PSEU|nr:hypothetical protein [Amycolatopsis bartoniae]MBB2938070.1 hypothetical protein [Amycolatopsis bartoniae]TVT09923.1 hypothetical protein FNH07_06630 [Amycolatopsis bartoniae]GHF32470.1 hypothetical protein GCM10017566_01280 [Amycolatopsis bartoniae]